MERRLAAILAADMVGYSRLMATDEAGTLARHNAHRKELIDPKMAEYGGRLVKSTGDGMLVEFSSVVDALRCAVTIQQGMPKREAAWPEEHRDKHRLEVFANYLGGPCTAPKSSQDVADVVAKLI